MGSKYKTLQKNNKKVVLRFFLSLHTPNTQSKISSITKSENGYQVILR